jgi:hypothetical protein
LRSSVNVRESLTFEALEYLKRYFAILVQEIAHLLAPILWQRWKEHA